MSEARCHEWKFTERTISALGATPFLAVVVQSQPQCPVLFRRISSASNNAFSGLVEREFKSKSSERNTQLYVELTKDGTKTGSAIVPFLDQSGSLKNTSTPSILPNNWRRSRPVACSSSVGTVPGFAPGPWIIGGPWSERRRGVVEMQRVMATLLRIAGRARRATRGRVRAEAICVVVKVDSSGV